MMVVLEKQKKLCYDVSVIAEGFTRSAENGRGKSVLPGYLLPAAFARHMQVCDGSLPAGINGGDDYGGTYG